jgi:hypothetical protein
MSGFFIENASEILETGFGNGPFDCFLSSGFDF